MNIPQLTALCLRYHGVLLDASEIGAINNRFGRCR